MTGLFVTVLNMSLIASLSALVVLLIRWCLKGRAPRWISYALWAVVLIRLLVPVSVSSPVSLFSLVPSQSTDAVGQSGRLSRLDVTGGAPARIPVSDRAGQDGSGETKGDEGQFFGQYDEEKAAEEPSTPSAAEGGSGWRTAAAVVWICGASALGAFLTLHYLFSAARLRRLRVLPENDKIRRAGQILPLRRKVRISKSRMFATPVVFGLFRPRIVLPWGFDWEDSAAQHILLHERVHISRWDNLAKIAATAAVCIHWFNPLVWLCFRLSSDDMEASCDERVLKILGEDSRKDYARSLLSMAQSQNRRIGVMPFLAFGESNLKQRVGNILKYHRKTLLSVTAVFLAVLLVGCSLLTNPSDPAVSSAGDDGQDISQSEGKSEPEEQQESGIAVKDPEKTTLYLLSSDTIQAANEDPESFYFPLPRPGVSQITASWLQEQLSRQSAGSSMVLLTLEGLEAENGVATVSLLADEKLEIAKENESVDLYLSSVAMTLLQNCELDAVHFLAGGEPLFGGTDGEYTPAQLIAPPMSREQILALYDTVTLEQLQKNLGTATDQTANPIDRWDLKGDVKAKEILDTIYDATIWNNVPERDFDSIEDAPNSFLLNAAYNQAPYIYWYQDTTEPNTIADFAVLTPMVHDFQCIPQRIVDETARRMFGDTVQIVPQNPRYGYYREYAMAYTPYHMGGWYPDIFLLDCTEQGDTVEAFVAYGRLFGSAGNGMKTLTDMDEEQSIRNREQRHRFTLQKTADGYRITGYHAVDTQRDMVSRAPSYYAYTAICGGLAFFDWDGAQNLTPDQLYRWFVAGYSPGVNDEQVSANVAERYFYAYTGYHPQNPEILRQSQYYDEEAQAYRVQDVEGVIGALDYSRQYWCVYDQVSYQDEDTALVPVKVYADQERSRLLADGVMKMKYQEDPSAPWIADGFTSN